MVLDKKTLLGLPIPLHAVEPPTHDDVDKLEVALDIAIRKDLSILPKERQLAPSALIELEKEAKTLSDRELIEEARYIIVKDLKDAFSRDLRKKVVPSKITEIWNAHNQQLSSSASSIKIPGPVTPGHDKSMESASPMSAETATNLQQAALAGEQKTIANLAALKLPSFARRNEPSASRNEHARARSDSIANGQKQGSHALAAKLLETDTTSPSLRDDDVTSLASADIVANGLPPYTEQQRRLDHTAITPCSDDESSNREGFPKTEAHLSEVQTRKPEVTRSSSGSEDELDAIVQQVKKKTEQKQKERLEKKQAKKRKSQKKSQTPAVVPLPLVQEILQEIIHEDHLTLESPDSFAMSTPAPTDITTVSSKRESSIDSKVAKKRAKLSPSLPAERLWQDPQEVCRIQSSSPDPIAQDLAEDEEDLYYLRLALQRKRAGNDYHPTPRYETEDEDEDRQEAHPESGSARTEGYYRIFQHEKLSYLTSRNQAVVDSSQTVPSSIAVSRLARVNARHLVLGLDKTKKATASDADVLQFNQLRTRKKQLRFARSPIHDWGLYAMEVIPAGEMVIEYVGETIRQQVADKREKAYERQGIGSSYLL